MSVVEIAKAEIGNRETGNNDNKYGKWYGANNQPACGVLQAAGGGFSSGRNYRRIRPFAHV